MQQKNLKKIINSRKSSVPDKYMLHNDDIFNKFINTN